MLNQPANQNGMKLKASATFSAKNAINRNQKLLTTIYMKKSLLLIALMVGCMSASAQKFDKNELRQLQSFLSQPGEKAATNAEALKNH